MNHRQKAMFLICHKFVTRMNGKCHNVLIMPFKYFRFPFLLILIFQAHFCFAGIAPFTERPKIDFDEVYKELASQGTWEKHPKYQWVFIPKAPASWKPYQNGQWVYSDGGWLWMGKEPWSWVTDHYGAWAYEKGQWKWIPSTKWYPSSVLWQEAGDLLGWRPVKLDQFQEVMDDIEVLRIHETWNVTLRTNLEHPIDASLMVAPEMRDAFLVKADACYHIYKTYRDFERAGPEPAKVWVRTAKPPVVYSIFTLPKKDTPPPAGAPTKNIYLYRPVFAQDEDGIFRRVKINIEGKRPNEKSNISEVLKGLSVDEKAKLDKIQKLRENKISDPVPVTVTNTTDSLTNQTATTPPTTIDPATKSSSPPKSTKGSK